MKKLLVSVLLVACSAGMAMATDYNPLTDWVVAPGDPAAWDFGGRNRTAYGVDEFGDFVAGVHNPALWTAAPDGDAYVVPNTADTCTIWWKEPWRGTSVAMMGWTTWAATARVTPEAGVYDVDFSFIGTGYAAPEAQHTKVYVIKNGSNILWQGLIEGPNAYTDNVGDSLTISFAAGDYLDFVSSNYVDGGSESRASLAANLVLVPEPVTMVLLGLGGLGLIRRRRA